MHGREQMKSSCISHPSNEQLIIIRKWQVQFCEGNHCAAALMSFFEYWHNWKINTDLKNKKLNDIAEQHGDSRSHNEAIFQFHSLYEITEGILDLFARNTVMKAVQYLESKSVLSTHVNPNPRYGFDKTKYYQFHPSVCTEWLSKECLTDGNTPSKFKNKPRLSEIKLSTFKNKPSSFKKGRSITKINYEDKNQSINSDDADFIKPQLLKNGAAEMIQPILDALIGKGLPVERLSYSDVIEAIKLLQEKGATPVLFEEAYDIAVHATQGRGFGVRYLNKVVENILAKSKEHKPYRALHPLKYLEEEKVLEKTYENEISHGSHWIDGDE